MDNRNLKKLQKSYFDSIEEFLYINRGNQKTAETYLVVRRIGAVQKLLFSDMV